MDCFFIGRLDVHIKNTSFSETCFKTRKTGLIPQSRRIFANARRRRTRAAEERAQRQARAAPANERNATGRTRMTTRTTATEAVPASKRTATATGPRARQAESRWLAVTKIIATIDPFRRASACSSRLSQRAKMRVKEAAARRRKHQK
jgi:hypothetical protein